VRRNSPRNEWRNVKRNGKKGASYQEDVPSCDVEGIGLFY